MLLPTIEIKTGNRKIPYLNLEMKEKAKNHVKNFKASKQIGNAKNQKLKHF